MQDILNSIKDQFNKLADGQFSFELYLMIAGAAVLFVFFFSLIFSLIRRKRQEKRYIEYFQREFTGNIRTTLQALQQNYRKGTDMWIGINKALFYLDHSIRRDYAGALRCIEHVTESDKIKALHREYLCKIPVTYLLPNNNS